MDDSECGEVIGERWGERAGGDVVWDGGKDGVDEGGGVVEGVAARWGSDGGEEVVLEKKEVELVGRGEFEEVEVEVASDGNGCSWVLG